MDTHSEKINQLLNKLKVLDSRIHKLESITDEVLNDVEHEYRNQINELVQKKEAAQDKLNKILEGMQQ